MDLILTSIPEKPTNIEGSQDILVTDHKLVKFCINLQTAKKVKAELRVYNFKKADCSAANYSQQHDGHDDQENLNYAGQGPNPPGQTLATDHGENNVIL